MSITEMNRKEKQMDKTREEARESFTKRDEISRLTEDLTMRVVSEVRNRASSRVVRRDVLANMARMLASYAEMDGR
jgi:hypothetical protein